MFESIRNAVRSGFKSRHEVTFPHAPIGWSRESAEAVARVEGVTLTEDHWQVVQALQSFYARHDQPITNIRELHDALDEHFHHEGGLKHLYELFPMGPVTQGCRIAGLQPPSGAQDMGFGSAV